VYYDKLCAATGVIYYILPLLLSQLLDCRRAAREICSRGNFGAEIPFSLSPPRLSLYIRNDFITFTSPVQNPISFSTADSNFIHRNGVKVYCERVVLFFSFFQINNSAFCPTSITTLLKWCAGGNVQTLDLIL
jgi:hypothetical protein